MLCSVLFVFGSDPVVDRLLCDSIVVLCWLGCLWKTVWVIMMLFSSDRCFFFCSGVRNCATVVHKSREAYLKWKFYSRFSSRFLPRRFCFWSQGRQRRLCALSATTEMEVSIYTSIWRVAYAIFANADTQQFRGERQGWSNFTRAFWVVSIGLYNGRRSFDWYRACRVKWPSDGSYFRALESAARLISKVDVIGNISMCQASY